MKLYIVYENQSPICDLGGGLVLVVWRVLQDITGIF